jgi:hypothetical protein
MLSMAIKLVGGGGGQRERERHVRRINENKISVIILEAYREFDIHGSLHRVIIYENDQQGATV